MEVEHSSIVIKTVREKHEDVNLPPARPISPPRVYLIPPLPPIQAESGKENMTYGYGHHFQHPLRNDIEKKTRARRASPSSRPSPPPPPPPTRKSAPVVYEIPPPPPKYHGPIPPPPPPYFAQTPVIHICRICLRPRSEKYHLEHPIVGVPPPPGICRRCRVKRVSDVHEHYLEADKIGESEPIRIGVACIVPEEDVLTKDEMLKEVGEGKVKRYRRIEEHSEESNERESSSEEEVEEKRKIVYRHVRAKDQTYTIPPPPPPQTEVSVENLAAMNLMNDRLSRRSNVRESSRRLRVDEEDFVIQPSSKPHAVKASRLDKLDTPTASLSAHTSHSTSADRQEIAEATISVHELKRGRSSVTAAAAVTKEHRPVYSESEIRHFARDEFKRYRQAERLVEAHPSPYAHGRMVPVVPVQKRIEVERDEVKARPWEIPPPPPVPVPELIPSSTRSRKDSHASKRSEKALSEDSRYWYHEPDRAPRERESASARERKVPTSLSTRTARTSSKRGIEREEDIEIVIGRERAPSPKRTAPDSDPPRSVKLREVVGLVKEEPARPQRSRSSRTPSTARQDIIEVIEEIELPASAERSVPAASNRPTSVRSVRGSEVPVSARVRELQEEESRRERAQKASDAPVLAQSGLSTIRTDTDYWKDDGVVKTVSQRSHNVPDDRRSPRPSPFLQETEVEVSMPSPGKFLENATYDVTPESDRTWYEARAQNLEAQQRLLNSTASTSRRYGDDDDKTVWPRDDRPIRPAASERASRVKEDWDWEYTERIVQPVDRPAGSNPFDREPARYVTEHEHLTRRKPSRHVEYDVRAPEAERSIRASPPRIRITPPTGTAESRGDTASGRGRDPYMRRSDESAHVRFASKVEFSPTPPGSDEYLPLRPKGHAERRDERRDQRRSGLSREVYREDDRDLECPEELIAEYERRRATREGSGQKKPKEFDFVDERSSGDADDYHGERFEMHGAVSGGREPRLEFTRERREHAGFKRGPLRVHTEHNVSHEERRRNHAPHRHRSRHRHHHREDEGEQPSRPPSAKKPEQLSRNQTLDRALSESPSRENLRMAEDTMTEARGRSTRAAASLRTSRRPDSRSLGTSQNLERSSERTLGRASQRPYKREDVESDGKGPYRAEARTASLDARYGSGHGGPGGRRQEFVASDER